MNRRVHRSTHRYRLIFCVAVSVTGQVIGHVDELLNHLGIAEIAGSGIACAAERDRADVAAVQERLGPATIVQWNSDGDAQLNSQDYLQWRVS